MKDRILQGDVREVLKELEDESVHCVVTSPPYWGLRDYGTAEWVGGSEECDHLYDRGKYEKNFENSKQATSNGTRNRDIINSKVCPKCGAIRQDKQLGLEETPQEHIEEMVKIFREVKRVLKKNGTLWMNYGDTYMDNDSFLEYGLKRKDLAGMPWRLALALQADGAASPQTMYTIQRIQTALLEDFNTWDQVPDKTRGLIESLQREFDDANKGGWYLRSDIIWHKSNPMPESVTDRPTKAHEYLFLLTKSSKYYYDQEAIREKTGNEYSIEEYNNALNVDWSPEKSIAIHQGSNKTDGGRSHPSGRNKRTVWTIPTAPYKEAHFAVFPPKLVEPCIKAGCPSKVCSKCGAPWERVLKKKANYEKRQDRGQPNGVSAQVDSSGWKPATILKDDYAATCQCNSTTEPGIVLDPFFGSGTVGQVAISLERHYLGIELNEDYIKLAQKRINKLTREEAVLDKHGNLQLTMFQ